MRYREEKALKKEKKKTELCAEAARAYFVQCNPKPQETVYAAGSVEARYDLMIIVPAYNVEKYLKQSIDSVLNQKTKYSYEVVIVDDGSTDATPEIADSYAKYDNIRVIHQRNRGLSGARNRALETITGRYVTFLDSDDYLLDNAVDAWLDTAYKNRADLVEGAYTFFEEGKKQIVRPHEKTGRMNPEETVKYAFGFAWGKVYRSELFSDFRFPEGYWYEDTVISMILFWKIRYSFIINQPVYAYRQNNSGITRASRGKIKSIDTYWVTEQCLEWQKAEGIPAKSARGQLLKQFYINYIRTKYLSKELQEMLFVLTADLYRKLGQEEKDSGSGLSLKERFLDHALKTQSMRQYKAAMVCWKEMNLLADVFCILKWKVLHGLLR